MTLEQLRAFVAIVESGSIRGGARTLNIAQSGLTQQVKRLEATLGVALFTRTHSGIAVTGEGSKLMSRARAILKECERIEDDFRPSKGSLVGHVNVACSVEAFLKLMIPVLRQLAQLHPDVTVHVPAGTASTRLTGVREGRYDFALTLSSTQHDGSDLVEIPLFKAKPVILCRRGHSLEAARSIRELASASWVNTRSLTAPGTPGNRLADLFTSHRLEAPKVAATVESFFDTLCLVSESDYLFLAPGAALETGTFDHLIAQVPIAEKIPETSITLVHSAQVPLPPVAQEVARMIVSYAHLARMDAD